MRRARGVAVAAAMLVLLIPGGARCGELQIHVIDVGQGSSELIIGPDGTTILIDGGTSGKGTSNVLPYLNNLFPPGGRHLDYVVCSHDHNDHYGGLNSVLNGGYTAGAVWHCGVNAGFGRGTAIGVGSPIPLGEGAYAACVAANGLFIDGAYVAPSASDPNSRSVALLIEYGDFDYLTAGDMPGTREDELACALVSYANPSGHPYHSDAPYLSAESGVDVLHANHHGSKTSSLACYLNAMKPEIALISGGTAYNHPTQDAVDRLLGRAVYSSCASLAGRPTGVTAAGALVYRTTASGQECPCARETDCPSVGDIVITTDGQSAYAVQTSELDPVRIALDEGFLNVDSDGDGLTNADEEGFWHTDPLLPDTDGDGYTDYMEAMFGSEPNLPGSTPVLRVSFQPGDADAPSDAMPAAVEDWRTGAGFGWAR